MACARDEPDELLERAGLERVGHRGVPGTRPAAAAWRAVLGGAGVVDVVPAGHPDGVAEVNRRWRRLADGLGVPDGDGVFLVQVPGRGCGCDRGWARVRLAEAWDLAGALGPEPGAPEFVTMSLDGERVVGCRTEAGVVRLVAVGGLGAWLEESARARVAAATATDLTDDAAGAAGSPAWASLLRRSDAAPRLRTEWRDGLARNPSAGADVLARLLDVGENERLPHSLQYRALPEEVVDAWITHPHLRVRKQVVERSLTPAQRERLFRAADTRLRWVALVCMVDGGPEFTDATFDLLAADPDTDVRAELVRHPGLPARHLATLAGDPEPMVRRSAVLRAWHLLDERARAALLTDADDTVRTNALLGHHLSTPLAAAEFDGLPADADRRWAAARCVLTRELAEALAHGPDAELRAEAADNPTLPADLVALLGQDADRHVRLRISLRPELGEEERSRIPVEIDPAGRHPVLDWVREQHDDPDAMRRLAASGHILVRRSVACAKTLPQDVADRLAGDEDRAVRLLLAEHCDRAPAGLLLEMWQTWDGYSVGRMPEHPNFPRGNAVRYADHPHPRMRRLALDDPESTVELVERFGRDTDYGVRWRALRDPRLSAASVVRLLDDPDRGLAAAAASDPRLPAGILAGLLADPAAAAAAATNPALPEALMHHLLDLPPADG